MDCSSQTAQPLITKKCVGNISLELYFLSEKKKKWPCELPDVLDFHFISYKSRHFMGKAWLFFSLHCDAEAKRAAASSGSEGAHQ